MNTILHGKTTAQVGENAEPAPLIRRAYKLKEAAAIIGLSVSSVRRLIRRGLLRRAQGVRHVLIPADEIERFLKQK